MVRADMLIATIHSALPETIDVGPLWVHLVPAGTFSGVDGRGPFHLRDPQAVIAASMQGANPRIPVDENHSTDLAGPKGSPSPARGWVTQMQVRTDGLWGLVEWNAAGQQLMAEKAYRGISPVFIHAADGTVLKVLRAALTNTPNLAELAFLHHQQDPSMDLPALRKALGLADTADAPAILAAVQANAIAVTAHAAQLAAIATAAGVPKEVDAPTLMAALQTQREAHGGAAKMATDLIALQTQLATLQAETKRGAAVAYVDGQIKAGKPIASLRDHFIARHVLDAAAVEKELGALVSINAGGLAIQAKKPSEMSDEDMMSAADKDVCQKMGLDPKAFAANKRKMAEAAERDGVSA